MKTLLALVLTFVPATGAVVSLRPNATFSTSFTFAARPVPELTSYLTISKPSWQWQITSQSAKTMAYSGHAVMLLPGEATRDSGWPTTGIIMDLWWKPGARGYIGTITDGYHGITDLSINQDGSMTVHSISYETARHKPVYVPLSPYPKHPPPS